MQQRLLRLISNILQSRLGFWSQGYFVMFIGVLDSFSNALCDSLRLKYPEGVKMLREAGVEMGDEEDLR